MLELTAQGLQADQQSRWTLAKNQVYRLGRAAGLECVIPWDPLISKQHVTLEVADERVEVRRESESRNPLLVNGTPVESATLGCGRHFVLGTTVFRLNALEPEYGTGPEQPLEEVAFNHQELHKVRYQDPENRIEVLTHLPEVIGGARNDNELHYRLTNLLLRGIVHAEAVAIVALDGADGIRVLHWERRRETAGVFHPSRRLVWEAVSHRRASVLHIWDQGAGASHEHTLGQEFDWAYCTPVTGISGEPTGLYIAGRMGQTFVPGTTLSDALQLEADVKFTELVSEIIGAVLRARRFERQKAGLRQFFAPPILATLGDELDTTLLEPRECDVTVMFCDLRGFSHRAESMADDLIGLLERVSRALGVMTQHILEQGGVTGDFQGDATLGFWGWPFPSADAAVHAARAALGIRAAFARAAATKNHPLADFAMGIGIAHGRAVAGKIGTAEQVKVTVFGPVVNLASRLEGLTKHLRVPIVCDEATARILRERLSPQEGRLRRLGKVLPYGMETPVLVTELLPSAIELPELSDQQVLDYERGVDDFLAGRWEDAYRWLHSLPASDRAPDFLTHHITLYNRVAPADWDGVIRLPTK